MWVKEGDEGRSRVVRTWGGREGKEGQQQEIKSCGAERMDGSQGSSEVSAISRSVSDLCVDVDGRLVTQHSVVNTPTSLTDNIAWPTDRDALNNW